MSQTQSSRFDQVVMVAVPPKLEQRFTPAVRKALGKVEVLHYLFWLNTAFFEEFTIYLYDLLNEEAKEIQPTWLQLHRCHKNEEVQHLVTDRVYIQRSPLSADERYQWSKAFCLNLEENFQQFFCLDAVEKAMQEAHPGLHLVVRTAFVVRVTRQQHAPALAAALESRRNVRAVLVVRCRRQSVHAFAGFTAVTALVLCLPLLGLLR